MNTRRYPRSMLDAFPRDHWRGVITHHRAPLLHRWWRVVAQVLFVVVMFAALGAALALGGRAFP